ncbi:MAG: nickel-dependent lactate racemase [candidate division Zixibacteria bacterium]|nr:nickel-dependent lactate racemase [candidate division Zixibacteria bacterium]
MPFGGQFQRCIIDEIDASITISGRYCCKSIPPASEAHIESRIVEGLEKFKRIFDNQKILAVVNDSYRRTPTAYLLSKIWDYVKNGEFIVAAGTHRKPTEDELSAIFGPCFESIKSRLHINDCYDQDSHIAYGHTSRGNPVELHRKINEADLILTINSVEPHFFAGFTGGRKSIIPGLASFGAVQSSHRLAKDIDSRTLNLETNPLHLDLEEGIQLLGDKPIITLQCVTDRDGNLIDLFVGNLREAFLEACLRSADCYTVKVPGKFDIVIANCEPPLDGNLYQLQKAQENGGRMVKSGGVLIVMGACREGTGSEYFMNLAKKYPSPELVLRDGVNDDSFGIHKLVKTARQLRDFRIFYVTTLDCNEVQRVYFESFSDLQSALESALKELGEDVEIAILEDAGYTVPVIEP